MGELRRGAYEASMASGMSSYCDLKLPHDLCAHKKVLQATSGLIADAVATSQEAMPAGASSTSGAVIISLGKLVRVTDLSALAPQATKSAYIFVLNHEYRCDTTRCSDLDDQGESHNKECCMARSPCAGSGTRAGACA